MTLIAVGQGLRKRANAGFSANAQLENRENAAADQIEAAEMQQQSQLYGTSSGIGASYGLQKSLQAGKAATDSISTLNAIPGLSEAGQFSAKGGKLVLDTGSTLVEGQQAINLATNATNQAAQALVSLKRDLLSRLQRRQRLRQLLPQVQQEPWQLFLRSQPP